MGKKLDFSYIRETYESKGFALLDTIFVNSHHKMKCVCWKHPDIVHEISLNHVKKLRGCNRCYDSNRRPGLEEVKRVFEHAGFELLEDHYVNNLTRMRCICKHHKDVVQYRTYGNVQSGAGCALCAGNARLTIDEARAVFEHSNYTLLEDTYVNNCTKMKCVCKWHPDTIQYQCLDNVRLYRCQMCKGEKLSGENHHNWRGGVSSLQEYVRNNIDAWKIDSAKACLYKCVITGEKMQVIHHLYSLARMLRETLEELHIDVRQNISMYTADELQQISDTCLSNHYKYGLGVCLTNNVHKEFHSIYGYDVTPDMFREFVDNYSYNLGGLQNGY